MMHVVFNIINCDRFPISAELFNKTLNIARKKTNIKTDQKILWNRNCNSKAKDAGGMLPQFISCVKLNIIPI